MIASDNHTYTIWRLNFWTLFCETLHKRDDENLILRLVFRIGKMLSYISLR